MADDDQSVRISLAANLELEGYQVTEASDGGEALALIASREFDLVVSDMVMPVANGVEVLRGLKRLRPDTPLILISAFVSESLVATAVREGLYTMLYKPVGVQEVLDVVDRALKRKWLLLVAQAEPDPSSLAAALESAGINVKTVFDVAEAVSFVQQSDVDVCVLELAADDLGALQAIRGADERLDVVVIAQSSSPETLQKVAKLGVSACLRPPVAISELLGAIVKTRAAARDGRS